MAIERAAVIGAGVMGAGIAAHLANAGIPVDLLDIVPEGAKRRSAVAEGALEKLKKAKPAAFMQRRAARLVIPGNVEDDLGRLAEADWIIEAVIEDLGIKRDLYTRIEAVRKPGSIVSSNTSTIPLAALVEELQHLDHPARRARRGAAGTFRGRFPDHPLLQSTALHAAVRAGHGVRHAARGGRGNTRLRRSTARQGGRRLSRHPRFHRQPYRHLLVAVRGQ
jgi:glycine/D-amino acid oxidase-like deaminating enzyme